MPLDLDAIRQRLAAEEGPRYWRGLEELTESAEFKEMLVREFPDQAEEWTDPVTRRQFLMLLGASLALAGVSGCATRPAPAEKIMPYVRQPEQITLGKPLFFATAMALGGVATGLLVESHEGRPTKVEGNPNHPASKGATDVFSQASILGLYDPDRSASVTYKGRPRPWNEALAALRTALEKQRRKQGANLRVLTETVTSPTLAAQLEGLLKDFPQAKWVQYEPSGRDAVLRGARQAFGEDVHTLYNFQKADVVLALDADFLSCGSGHLRYTRDFINRRRVRGEQKTPQEAAMNRLYVVECTLTATGLVADHRLPVRNSQIENLARALAAELEVSGAPPADALAEAQRHWIAAVARDLKQHQGAGIVIVGDGQPPAVHALAHAINGVLGNDRAGGAQIDAMRLEDRPPVSYIRSVEARPADQFAELRQLAQEMEQRQVDILLILGGNPVFNAPVDVEFGKHLLKVPLRVHLGLYEDETAVLCDWHIPEAHYLESWGDARAFDGTVSIVQPLIAPLYDGRSVHEMLAALTERPERLGYDIVRDYWQKAGAPGDFEQFWQKALQDGVLPDFKKDFAPKSMRLKPDWATRGEAAGESAAPGGPLEIVFRADPTIYDGRFANNGWLQELPKPVTKITWDNAAFMSPKTAKDLGVSYALEFLANSDKRPNFGAESGSPGPNGGEHGQALVDVVELTYRGRKLHAPVWILPGHADGAVTVHFGYGRTRAGRVGGRAGQSVGFDAYQLRTSQAPWFDNGLQVRKLETEEKLETAPQEQPRRIPMQHTLACTQMHFGMQERDPVHAGTLEGFKKDALFAQYVTAAEHVHKGIVELLPGPKPEIHETEPQDPRLTPLTMYPQWDYEYPKYRWGMAIDLSACVGCSACVVACQAENNIPVVGKTEVTRGREMHWLRIDRYFVGDLENPAAYFQPVPCMQCEKAPCEQVCPVGATVHSHDGLNDMVYNRCVGTRYCSNNCPYKVRRFNFLAYTDYATASLKLSYNPEVTVRSRGVMEKCTYCVQRIRAADIEAEKRMADALAAIAAKKQAGALSAEEAARQADKAKAELRIRDGEVLTACQAACPAQAIVFGDINDKDSQVYHAKDGPLNYGLLAELNTMPRTTYLAALRNPNPELATPGQPEAHQ